MRKILSYSELIKYDIFADRFEYLKLGGVVGEETFGYERILNQTFYTSKEWRSFRRDIIIRDNGCDLGVEGYDIFGRIEIHHLNPITAKDIRDRSSFLMDPENVISTSSNTHKAIHYGDASLIITSIPERKPNDMCPWLNS